MTIVETVERLRDCLLALERSVDVPRLDVEWLRLRCDDTLRFHGQLQRDSLRQLQKDVADFVEEFPYLIPASLIDEVKWVDGELSGLG
ncbi:hypothetical protein WMF31_02510 [Sorangium sp. So ce1036]|uniref:hypothetical protein n=1 Tax=Sorangium sp. So ce1036 TaxID=3133328 RepID=UPI003F0618E5